MSNPLTPAGNAFVGGGVTPEQAALSQYTFGERALGGASRFGASGLGMSTNETLAGTVGPSVGQAESLSTTSDQLTAALSQFANVQQLQAKGLTTQQLGALGHFAGKGGSTGTGSGA